jgi:hypothetical protein
MMKNNPATKPTWAKVPIDLLDDIDFLELSESPDPIAVYFMGLLLAKESGAGGTVMVRDKPASLKNLAYRMGYYQKEKELESCLLKLDKAGYIRFEDQILFYPEYAILQAMSVAERKILYDGICQRIYTHRHSKTETNFDKVLMIPFQTIYSKIGKEKILSILDSPSEDVEKGLENLYEENYNANLVKAIIIELKSKFINDEKKFEEIFNLLESEKEETPPETPSELQLETTQERTGTPTSEKSGEGVRLPYSDRESKQYRSDGQPMDFIPRIVNRSFSMVYDWFQSNLQAFDVVFKGEDINRVKNAFVDYASDGHNGKFAEFLDKYEFTLSDDRQSWELLEIMDKSYINDNDDNDDDEDDEEEEFDEYPF